MISVIIPVYNVQAYLDSCVISVVQQSYVDLEIILVDDGSTDNSGEMCDSWEKRDSRIKVIHQTNGGLSAARNTGLEFSKGDYITFVDSDDWIDKEMYANLVELLQHNPCIDIACCGIEQFADWDSKKTKPFLTRYDKDFTSLEYAKLVLKHKIDNAVCNKLFKRSLLEKIRFKYGKINEDILFIFDVLKSTRQISYISNPFYKYRIRKGSITQQANPNLFDFIDNAFCLKDLLLKEMKLSISEEIEGYIYHEMTNYIATIEKYNSQINYEKEIKFCKQYIMSHYLHSFSNHSWSLPQKMKFFLVSYFPSFYRYLLTKYN